MLRMSALAGMLFAFTLLANAEDPPRRELPTPTDGYFPTKVGSTWIYSFRDGTTELKRRTLSIIKSTKEDSKTTLTIGLLNGKEVTEFNTIEITDKGVVRTAVQKEVLIVPQVLIPYPIKIGEKWEWESAQRHMGMRVTNLHHLKSIEKIDFLGGKYEALRIEQDPISEDKPGKATKNSNSKATRGTSWYVFGMGRVRTELPGYVEELVQFTPGK